MMIMIYVVCLGPRGHLLIECVLLIVFFLQFYRHDYGAIRETVGQHMTLNERETVWSFKFMMVS